MPHVFWTFFKWFGIFGFNVLFYQMSIGAVDAVPEFGFSIMVVVYTVHVIVLGVNGKHCPKASNI